MLVTGAAHPLRTISAVIANAHSRGPPRSFFFLAAKIVMALSHRAPAASRNSSIFLVKRESKLRDVSSTGQVILYRNPLVDMMRTPRHPRRVPAVSKHISAYSDHGKPEADRKSVV